MKRRLHHNWVVTVSRPRRWSLWRAKAVNLTTGHTYTVRALTRKGAADAGDRLIAEVEYREGVKPWTH